MSDLDKQIQKIWNELDEADRENLEQEAQKMQAHTAELEEDLKHFHSRWDYVEYWFSNLYPSDWDRCMKKYDVTKDGARPIPGGDG